MDGMANQEAGTIGFKLPSTFDVLADWKMNVYGFQWEAFTALAVILSLIEFNAL